MFSGECWKRPASRALCALERSLPDIGVEAGTGKSVFPQTGQHFSCVQKLAQADSGIVGGGLPFPRFRGTRSAESTVLTRSASSILDYFYTVQVI